MTVPLWPSGHLLILILAYGTLVGVHLRAETGPVAVAGVPAVALLTELGLEFQQFSG